MALAAAVAGALRPSQLIVWERTDGALENLTGATITGKIRNQRDGVTRDIAGVLTVVDGAAAQFRWDYAVADVAEADTFWVQFTATFADSPTPARTFAAEWSVEPAL
jgi:hypothetical protein